MLFYLELLNRFHGTPSEILDSSIAFWSWNSKLNVDMQAFVFNAGLYLEVVCHISGHALIFFGFKHRLLELELNFRMYGCLFNLWSILCVFFVFGFTGAPSEISDLSIAFYSCNSILTCKLVYAACCFILSF